MTAEPATRRRPDAIGPARKARKITQAKARQLVDLAVALEQCTDCSLDLRRALDDAVAAVQPWYSREDQRR